MNGGAGLHLGDDERRDWLRLIRSENVGPVTFRELLDHFGSAAAALTALPRLAERGGRRVRVASSAEAEDEMAALAAIDARLVAIGEPDYPAWLAAADGAPPLIALRGNPACLAAPMVAVVGSRNASVVGRKFAARMAGELGAAGLTVASGLARGIDAAAHEGSLATGTVAVFAGGLERPYPPDNLELAARILDRGAHLSEMPINWQPRGRDFPRRNRIISGLAMGVVVVEAAERSGSLITARRAADQGRLVFAVPGSPLDPRAAGSNRLLKEGATLVTEAEDVIAALRPMLAGAPAQGGRGRLGEPDRPPPEPPAGAAGDDRRLVLEALGPSPVAIDEVIRFTGLTPALVHLVLIELDLAGRLERHPGQRVSLI